MDSSTIIKLLEENIGRTLFDVNCIQNIFLDLSLIKSIGNKNKKRQVRLN